MKINVLPKGALVHRLGFEPRTSRSRGRCSTTEASRLIQKKEKRQNGGERKRERERENEVETLGQKTYLEKGGRFELEA